MSFTGKAIALLLGTQLVASASLAHDQERATFHLDERVEREVGYAQAVRVGDTLYISGTVGAGEMPNAIRSAYDKLKQTLNAHGLDFQHVVKENVFATQLDELIKHKELRRQYYGETLPAATWVQVDRLYVPQFVIEVELIALFPSQRGGT